MYNLTIQQFKKMLSNLSNILDKAVLLSETKKFDMSNLLNARLYPNQFSLIKQIQVCCDNAKGAAARLSGKEAPKHEDNEKTVEELKERINKVVDYLNTFSTDDFAGAADRKIELFFIPGKYITGEEYLVEFVTPNFYFHITTAYSILRHNSVEIGKMDFMGNINFKPLES